MSDVTETPTDTPSDTSDDIELLIENEYEDIADETPDATLADENITDEADEADEAPTQPSGDVFVGIKYNGKEMDLTKEEAVELAQKGLDYSAKTMKLSEHKELLGSLEQYGIKSIEDLNKYMAEGGNHIQEPEPSPYSEDVESIATEIMSRENAGEFREVIESLPDSVRKTLAAEAKTLVLYTTTLTQVWLKSYCLRLRRSWHLDQALGLSQHTTWLVTRF